jgi:hypothetical protein
MASYKPKDNHWQSRLAAIEGRPEPEPIDYCRHCGEELDVEDTLPDVCNTCIIRGLPYAQTPQEYLHAEAAYLRSLDDTSGNAEMMEKAAKEIEDLRRKLGDAERGIEIMKGHNQSWMDDCAKHLKRIDSFRLALKARQEVSDE